MNKFDKYIKSKINKDEIEVPKSIDNKIDEVLNSLPEKDDILNKRKATVFRKIVAVAAVFAFVTLFALPNVSVAYAKALESIPIIGDIIHVVTIRNYLYSDNSHELDIEVPGIVNDNDSQEGNINADIQKLTDTLINRFYKDLEKNGSRNHLAISMSYDIITNSDKWFTLKISVTESAASSNQYYKFYHIDRAKKKIVYLKDLFVDDNYKELISSEIQKQMKRQMRVDSSVDYWLDEGEYSFSTVSPEQNFYWNKNGNLVIVFDKYEVGPGFMGTPEFEIPKNILKDVLKNEYLKNNFVK